MRGHPVVLVPEDVVARIRARFNVSDVAGRLGYQFKRSGHEYVGLCPWHGERTPSWTLNDAKGFAHCFGCGAHHDTIALVRSRLGLEGGRRGFIEALQWLDSSELPAVDPVVRAAEERAVAEEKMQQIRDARSWFADADNVRRGDHVDTYLAARSIMELPPPTIRTAWVPAWQDRKSKRWGRRRPCMLCAAQDGDGSITGVQRVFFVNDDASLGKAEKPKRTWGAVKGSALRLGEAAAHINVAEGPEDGLSVREMMPERPVWTVFGTGMMPFVGLPGMVEEVTLLGQNNRAGRDAVAKAGEALLERGLAARVAYPPEDFDDWNDLKRGVKK